MVEDSVWQSVADGVSLLFKCPNDVSNAGSVQCEGTLPQIKKLIKEILRTHEIRTDDGMSINYLLGFNTVNAPSRCCEFGAADA